MKEILIKILTSILLISFSPELFASIVTQQTAKTHLRWNLYAPKQHLVVEKKGTTVYLRTLNTDLYSNLKKDIENVQYDSKYIRNVQFKEPDEMSNVPSIQIQLAKDDIELFTFYKDREKKYVIDFWRESDEVGFSKAAIKKKPEDKGPEGKVAEAPVKKKVVVPVLKAPVVVAKPVERKKKVVVDNGFRDFRYGASFVWDYEPMEPEFKKIVRLDRKTPEHFYPIKDREFKNDEKESHIQLSINLFRKKKWGLMYKSIKLFREKYGEDEAWDVNEYLKANAILRDNIGSGNREPLKMAINMLGNLAEKTKDYELKKGITKYLLAYSLEKNEYVKALKIAKRYYVVSKEIFDYEETKVAAESIMFCLTKLNQIEKIKEVLNEKTIVKLVPRQTMIMYELFTNMKLGNIDEVIKIYEKQKASLAKPVHEVILYNTAEAYFRKSEFTKAINLYDEFLTTYSFHPKAAQARVRMALIFEISGKNINEVIALYKNAINRSQDFKASYEAKIRYVALRSVRKKEIDANDKEIRVFLELNDDEKKGLTKDLKKLLWLTRLRTYIADKKYDAALAYLKAIPVTALTPVEKRVFEADGAEIVYGIIADNFENSKYSNAVKVWNTYKKKYVSKVANNPYMNFIVGKSYLKLGLYNAFDGIYKDFVNLAQTPNRTYPLWVDRNSDGTKSDVVSELAIVKNIKLKNWDLAQKDLDELSAKNPTFKKIPYYQGVISFNKKEFFKAARSFEVFLSEQREKVLFDPSEVAEMLTGYTDSLYQLGKLDKFEKVSLAILSDTDTYASDNIFMKNVRERLSYLHIELMAGKEDPAAGLKLEPAIIKFKKEYEKSSYIGRVNYLLGLSYVNSNRVQKGRDLFNEILSDDKVSKYIKDLVRSELSMLTIKEKAL